MGSCSPHRKLCVDLGDQPSSRSWYIYLYHGRLYFVNLRLDQLRLGTSIYNESRKRVWVKVETYRQTDGERHRPKHGITRVASKCNQRRMISSLAEILLEEIASRFNGSSVRYMTLKTVCAFGTAWPFTSPFLMANAPIPRACSKTILD